MLSVRSTRRGERGTIAIMVALSLAALLVLTGMVLDFGLARLDRQVNKSTADSAVTSGMRAMDLGDGAVHPWSGVCGALSFIKANQPALAGLPTPSECANPAKLTAGCTPGDSSTFAVYNQTHNRYTVKISIPYPATDPYTLASTQWPEEQSPTLLADQGEAALKGCDQLGVEMYQTRKPGLGSIATSSELTTGIHSVGRVTINPYLELPVALLLLERTSCKTLEVSGTGTRVHVKGNQWAPGLIQADSTGTTSCTGSAKVLDSTVTDGIVAFAAETSPLDEFGNPTTLTPLPGILGSVALYGGDPSRAAGDPGCCVYSLAYGDTKHYGPIPRPPTGRLPVDKSYREGVRAAMAQASTYLVEWASLPPTDPRGSSWVRIEKQGGGCKDPTPLQLAAAAVYFDCSPAYAAATIFPNAKTVVINGSMSKMLDLPVADRVFIKGGSGNTDAIKLTGTNRFAMHQGVGNSTCSDAPGPERARLVIGGGQITSSGTFIACHTSVLFMNDQYASPIGCVPLTSGTPPTDSPCPGAGNGYINFTGGPIEWTAPNRMQDMTDPATAADRADLEDLALWTEAAVIGNNLSSGGASMHLKGVFFAPNANPFNLHGQAGQNAEDAQYIVRKLTVTGGATLTMKPNPYNAVRIPVLGGFLLVR